MTGQARRIAVSWLRSLGAPTATNLLGEHSNRSRGLPGPHARQDPPRQAVEPTDSPCSTARKRGECRLNALVGCATFRASGLLGLGDAMRFLLAAEEFCAAYGTTPRTTSRRSGVAVRGAYRRSLRCGATAQAGTPVRSCPVRPGSTRVEGGSAPRGCDHPPAKEALNKAGNPPPGRPRGGVRSAGPGHASGESGSGARHRHSHPDPGLAVSSPPCLNHRVFLRPGQGC